LYWVADLPKSGWSAERAGKTDEGAETQPGRCCAAGWSRFDILPCRDGKARRVESGSFPLAHGIPGRMGLLRGYGNAIVPQVAEVFIRAWLDSLPISSPLYPSPLNTSPPFPPFPPLPHSPISPVSP
jgi:DNA (cytosine-5)-methyltransferase 1